MPNYRIPVVVQTPSGLVAFAEARNGSDFTASRIASRASGDDGATWSDVTFVEAVIRSVSYSLFSVSMLLSSYES